MIDLAFLKLSQFNVPTVQDGNVARLFNRIEQAKGSLNHVLEKGYDHWIITFSGGKDSTSSIVVSLETALERAGKVKRIDIVYADTLIEIPTIRNFAVSFLRKLKNLSRIGHLPLKFHITKPEIQQRFWVRMLGKGYPPPHQRFRWCTKRLKIDPVEKSLKGFIQPNRTVIITGVRFGESNGRDKRLSQSCSRGGECGQGIWFTHSNRLKAGYLAPLINWSNCDIWDFLTLYAPEMGYPTTNLEQVYNGHETRFGCWMCTVVRQDKAMEKTIAQPKWNHLAPIAEFRNYVWRATRGSETRERREDGLPGRLKLGVRKNLLNRLEQVQKKVGFELISEEEILEIRKLWKHKR